MSDAPTPRTNPRVREAVAIKICGLTSREDARLAEEAGARYLGVIFAGGPRLLSQLDASRVLGPARPNVARVGVFGSQNAKEIVSMIDALDLEVAQLHETPSIHDVRHMQRETGRAFWPVLRVKGTSIPEHAFELAEVAGTLVLDSHVAGRLGGTGVALDWNGLAESIEELRLRVPAVRLVLAGGLRPHNVGEAIRFLSPDAVDVSSGVEKAVGVKDPVEIERFVNAVRHATGNAA